MHSTCLKVHIQLPCAQSIYYNRLCPWTPPALSCSPRKAAKLPALPGASPRPEVPSAALSSRSSGLQLRASGTAVDSEIPLFVTFQLPTFSVAGALKGSLCHCC
jgi:hypothetical protein